MKQCDGPGQMGVFWGMAAGAALGAAGAMLAGQNQRAIRRTTRKMAKEASHAVSQLDKLVTAFVASHLHH